jgi:signal transduction histidine kinase
MTNTDTNNACEAWVTELTQAWTEIVQHANPELEAEDVRATSRDLARSLLEVVTAGTLDRDAAREIGAGMEVWEHLELDHLFEMQERALRYYACVEGEAAVGAPSALMQAVLAVGHGFYAARVARARRLGMESMSRMSHDLKTPINAITGFSRVILKGIDGPITDFQQEDLTSIYEAGKKLLTMVNDLFAVRKRDAARPAIYGASFEVATLVADLMRTVQPLAAESGHTLRFELEGELGSMTADPTMVRWIFLGLLMYAMRQMRRGLLRVSVTREERDAAPHLVVHVGYEELEDEQPPVEPERAMSPQAEAADVSDWAKDDLVLETCLNFCQELDGELTSEHSENGVVFQMVLPM